MKLIILVICLFAIVAILIAAFKDTLFGNTKTVKNTRPSVAVVDDNYIQSNPIKPPIKISEPTIPTTSNDFDEFTSEDISYINSAKQNLNFCLYEKNAYQGMYNLVNTSDMGFNPSTAGVDSVKKIKEWAGKRFDAQGNERLVYKSAKVGDSCEVRDYKGKTIAKDDGVMILTKSGKYLTAMPENTKVRQHTKLYDTSFWKIKPVGDIVNISLYNDAVKYLKYDKSKKEFVLGDTVTEFKVLQKDSANAILYNDNGVVKSLTYSDFDQSITSVTVSSSEDIKYTWAFKINDNVKEYTINKKSSIQIKRISENENDIFTIINTSINSKQGGTYICDSQTDPKGLYNGGTQLDNNDLSAQKQTKLCSKNPEFTVDVRLSSTEGSYDVPYYNYNSMGNTYHIEDKKYKDYCGNVCIGTSVSTVSCNDNVPFEGYTDIVYCDI